MSKRDSDPQHDSAATRLLILADHLTATQLVNFHRPYSAMVAAGQARIDVWTDRDIATLEDGAIVERWTALCPTALIMSRYTGARFSLVVDCARCNQIPVIYHLDDDLFSVPEALGAAKHAHYNNPARLARLRAAIEASDLVYTSTSPLAAELAHRHGISRPIVAGKIGCGVEANRMPPYRPRDTPTLGYMASSSHGADAALMLPALMRLMSQNHALRLEFFGTLPAPSALVERFGSRVGQIAETSDYDAFLNKLSELGWWVGLAPLEDTHFNRCKTEIKWMEYSFAGIATVASDVDVYRRCCHGDAGVLVPDDTCWAALVGALLNDHQRRKALVDTARSRVAREYSLDRLQRQVGDVIAEAKAITAGPLVGTTPGTQVPANPVGHPPGPRPKEFERWIAQFDAIHRTDQQRIDLWVAARGAALPLVSIVIIGSQDAEASLTSTRSVLDQDYPNWELLAWGKNRVDRPFDRRIKVVEAPQGLADLARQASGTFTMFVRAGDVVAPHALTALIMAVEQHEGHGYKFGFAYADEDEIDSHGFRSQPYFKTDWDLDLFLGQDYASRLCLVETETARRLADGPPQPPWIYRLLLRIAAEQPARRVEHAPFVLCHRPALSKTAEAQDQVEAQAVAEFLTSPSVNAAHAEVRSIDSGRRVCWPLPASPPPVSLVIPTRDRLSLLARCVSGLLDRTTYPDLEVIIVDNDSAEAETLTYLSRLTDDPRVKTLFAPGPFNFSALNNFGVRQARGSIVGLLNNDLEVVQADWLEELVRQALRPDVGAVGPMLYYGSGAIQHAGVILGVGGVASHIMKNQPQDSTGYAKKLGLVQQFSAVTGACMLMRTDIWRQVGGLDESLPVAFNDIDLCLKVRQAGYKILWTPFAKLTHHESQSRGSDVDPQRRRRLMDEMAKMKHRWGEQLTLDPFFSPNLSLRSVECRPAFPPRVTWPWWKVAQSEAPDLARSTN